MVGFRFLVLLLLPFLARAEVLIYVNASVSLDSAGRLIKNAADTQTRRIIVGEYTNPGTLTIPADNTSKVDTVIVTSDPGNPGILKLGSKPLLNVQGFKRTLVLEKLNIQVTQRLASISSSNDAVNTNHSLILRDCLIFGDSLNSTAFLAWQGGAGSKILLQRCMFGVKVQPDPSAFPLTRFLLAADTVHVSNTSFNLAGKAEVKANKHFRMGYSTINRLLFSIDGNVGVTANIHNNLFVHHSPSNVINGLPIFYGIYPTSAYSSFTGLGTNYAYSGWEGVIQPTNGSTENTTKITALPRKDTTELWNWYTDEYPVGIGHGPDSVTRYNIFPGTRTGTVTLYNRDTLSVWFKDSPVPRIFSVQVPGRPPPNDRPEIRYVWPTQRAFNLGNIPIDSFLIRGGTAIHGLPVLLTQASADTTFDSQPATGFRQGPRLFRNQRTNAQYFLPGYLCDLPRGLRVAVGGALSDSIVFRQIDSAGYGKFAISTIPTSENELFPYTRALDSVRGYGTTAVLKDSLEYGTRVSPVTPLLSDSLRWLVYHKGARLLLRGTVRPNGWRWVTLPPSDTVKMVMVERLSIPRDTQNLKTKDYAIYTRSANGFQLLHDTATTPSPDQFDKVSKAVRLQMLGRGLQDSVVIELASQGANTAFWIQGGQVDTLTSVLVQPSGKVKVVLGSNELNGVLFLGRQLNIRRNVAFNQAIQGLQFTGLISATSGMLGVSAMKENDFANDTLLRSHRFIKGWTLKPEGLATIGAFSVSDVLGAIVDPRAVGAYVRLAGAPAWTPASLTVVNEATGLVTVNGLALGQGNLEILFVEVLGDLKTLPDVTTRSLNAASQVFTFQWKPDPSSPTATHYQIEIRAVDESGLLTTSILPVTPVGQVVADTLATNGVAVYRIKVFNGTRLLANRTESLQDAFDVAAFNGKPERQYPALKWHLVSVPYSGRGEVVDTAWMRYPIVPNGTLKDSVAVLGIDKGKLVAEPMRKRKTGEAILIAASQPLRLQWTRNQVPSLDIVRIEAPGPGWKWVGHPFVFPMTLGPDVSNQTKAPAFFALTRSPGAAGGRDSLSWTQAASLSPYTGYAYYFQQGEVLTLDPFKRAQGLVKAGQDKVASLLPPSNPAVVLADGFAVQRAELVPGGAPRDEIPWLPAPGEAVDMRLGSDLGYLRKAIPSRSLVHLPLTLQPSRAGKAHWRFERAEAGTKAVLFDSLTGAIYQSGDSLTLAGGRQGLSLWVGPVHDVEVQEQGWVRRMRSPLQFQAPWVLRGHQPFELAWNWPASYAAEGATLRVRLTDTRGKSHLDVTLKPRAAGRQSEAWPRPMAAGNYILTAVAKGRTASSTWQQKCTVLP